ncbi:hypothetical protein GP486_004733 [Trichoglossum hirsutum]|uniref:RRM domain-containing protein n=1 Tax=Trichoglossum hirsutum TaxID=265104 RepID=A0A9P8LAG1_9PEZI|nr:hypothetical protein GP486_004733 [Trichoglossum hirsutum]
MDKTKDHLSGQDEPRTAFPQSPEEFEHDTRVFFSKLEGKWLLEAEDGSEFEYDDALRRWIPVLDEALAERQQQAYAVAGADESVSVERKKKRKAHTNGEDVSRVPIIRVPGTALLMLIQENGDGKAKKPKGNGDAPARKNKAVYVTNLPLDTTIDEVQSVFSKCGVIAEEIDRGKLRIKLYTDEAGNFKGDALVVYFRAESVALAVQMLDDTDFRLGASGGSGKMSVQPADFSYKSQQEAPTKPLAKDKRKIMKKTQKLNSKLADWDDDDPSTLPDTSSRWDKVVILKHMFTLQELEEDPAAILDIKDDVREECAKLGEVTNVVLFDKEAEGVASVRFADADAAKACVRLMDGRYFSGTRVEAYIADGTEKFRKSSERKFDAHDEGEGDEEGQRLDKFGSWLEGDGA